VSYHRGKVVGVRGGRLNGDYVISGTRRIQRGRRAGQVEYQLAPLDTSGRYIGARVIGDRYFGAPSKTYTREQVDRALDVRDDRYAEKAATKRAHQFERQDLLTDMGVQVGDTVRIRGRGCPNWDADVVQLNYRTGKIGIRRSEGAIAAAEQRAYAREQMRELGLDVGRGRVQKVRWITTHAIIKVVREGETVWDESQKEAS